MEVQSSSGSSFSSPNPSQSFASVASHRRTSFGPSTPQYASESSSQMTTGPTTPTYGHNERAFDPSSLDIHIVHPAMSSAMSYDAMNLAALEGADVMTGIEDTYPTVKSQQHQDLWGLGGHVGYQDGFAFQSSLHDNVTVQSQGVSMPCGLPILPSNESPLHGAFAATSTFSNPAVLIGLSTPHTHSSPKTVSLPQLDGAATSVPVTTPQRYLRDPFTTPVKTGNWVFPGSSSSTSWSSRSSHTPASLASPQSPTPTPRGMRARLRTAARRSTIKATPTVSAATSLPTPTSSTHGDHDDNDGEDDKAKLPHSCFGSIVRVQSGIHVCTKPVRNERKELVECGKRFQRSEHLTRHWSSGAHTDERKHWCRICHQRFDRSDNCKMHVERHFKVGSKIRVHKTTHNQPLGRAEAIRHGYLDVYEEFMRRERGEEPKGKGKRTTRRTNGGAERGVWAEPLAVRAAR